MQGELCGFCCNSRKYTIIDINKDVLWSEKSYDYF